MTLRQILNQLSTEINSETDPAKKQALQNRIKTFMDGAGIEFKNGKWQSKNGSNIDKDYEKLDTVTKDMLTKTTGWTPKGKVQTEKEKEARQSFVNANPKKVTPEVVARQENNITNFDQGTSAGQGRNTAAAKKAQEAQRNSRKLVNEVKQDGVADIPVTDDRSDAYYEDGASDGGATNTGATEQPQISGTNGNPSETTTPEERQGNMNGLLLADMLMTGVRNALHYRPSFRTAYGTSYDGQEFGNEKSLAGRMAEENMKRGLERMNARQDYRAQQEEQIAATKAKGSDAGYLAAEQALTRNVSPTQKQWSNSSSNILGSKANAGATTEWDNPNALAQRVQSSR